MLFKRWEPESHWENHPEFTPEDWACEATDNDTRQGYVDWVNSQLEARHLDEQNQNQEDRMPDLRYIVSWDIDVPARTYEEAAFLALKIQRDPDSIGLCFHVREGDPFVPSKNPLIFIDLADHAVCQGCGHVFRIDKNKDFTQIEGLSERVLPGDMVPVCDCPKCRNLAYPATKAANDHKE